MLVLLALVLVLVLEVCVRHCRDREERHTSATFPCASTLAPQKDRARGRERERGGENKSPARPDLRISDFELRISDFIRPSFIRH